MEYVVDLGDYKQEVVDKFMAELESKSDVKWNSGQKPTQYKMPAPMAATLHYCDGVFICRSRPDVGTVLSRAQFIEKMSELHPKKKQDIREYCKEHRVWAMKASGVHKPSGWYWTDQKPELDIGRKSWVNYGLQHDSTPFDEYSFTFPDVPWGKSLIAPDGSMPLMEEKKTVKHFEVGKWYVNVGENKGIDISWSNKSKVIDGKPHKCTSVDSSQYSGCEQPGFDGQACGTWNVKDWIEVPAPDETYKPKRNDPIFVWDDGDDDRCPCPVYYVHHVRKNGNVVDFMDGEYCVEGKEWDHYRKFDASLVGVPRREWNKRIGMRGASASRIFCIGRRQKSFK